MPRMNMLVLFSGPHGKSIPMDDFENILMIASDIGIAAHLRILSSSFIYNSREVRACRIHLVWQVRDIGKLWPLSSLVEQKADRARRHNRGPAAP
jgi:NAD(P)H-flavin reductase